VSNRPTIYFNVLHDIPTIDSIIYRRSATLRTYAGDTSLPGGKRDPEDRNPEETAVRAPLFVSTCS